MPFSPFLPMSHPFSAPNSSAFLACSVMTETPADPLCPQIFLLAVLAQHSTPAHPQLPAVTCSAAASPPLTCHGTATTTNLLLPPRKPSPNPSEEHLCWAHSLKKICSWAGKVFPSEKSNLVQRTEVPSSQVLRNPLQLQQCLCFSSSRNSFKISLKAIICTALPQPLSLMQNYISSLSEPQRKPLTPALPANGRFLFQALNVL